MIQETLHDTPLCHFPTVRETPDFTEEHAVQTLNLLEL